jgi:hypothetical protein
MNLSKLLLASLGAAGLFIAACAASASNTPSHPPPASPPCSGPEWKQLDFWVGDWDLTWPATGPNPAGTGTNRITKILGGCVVQENFHGSGEPPLTGMSVSTFNPQLKKWQQTWVDDQGSYLDFTGQFENGEMTLSMERTNPAGKPVKLRMIFKNIRADSLDWSWEKSADSGKTWQVQWPIHYVRKKP